MRFVAVLNREGGILRTADLDVLSASISEALMAEGHIVDINIVSGSHLEAALSDACSSSADVVLIGGGDGTVSAAAGKMMDTQKILAVLPAGTMNLFARSLAVPLALDAAILAYATGKVRAVDIATANGKPFVHQFSIGMHARMIEVREGMEFASRAGKLYASARAAWTTVVDPRTIKVRLDIGGAAVEMRATAVGISNNLFGDGHLPYADCPDGGTLGIYVTLSRRRSELFRLLVNMARGKWAANGQVEVYEARKVLLTVLSRRTRLPAALDGELIPLQRQTEFEIQPGDLRVLMPAASARAKAA